MQLKCDTHSSPEKSLKEFLENVFSSLISPLPVKVYDIQTMDQAIELIMKMMSCPVCSRSLTVSPFDKYVVRYMKTEEGAKMPFRTRDSDAGWDLYAIATTDLLPHRVTEVPTGIALEMPSNLYATIEGRSSFHSRGIHTNRGIIDAEYRGEITVFMQNNTDTMVTVKKWERFAQLIFHYLTPVELIVTKELTPSSRGTGRLGSTGRF